MTQGLGKVADIGRIGLDAERRVVGKVDGYFGVGLDDDTGCGRTVGNHPCQRASVSTECRSID